MEQQLLACNPEDDLRNVDDRYKGWLDELIVSDLEQNYCGAQALVVNIEKDFNFSCVVRCANNFGISDVHYIGPRRWDKRGAVGSHHYTSVNHVGLDAQDSKKFFEENDRPVIMVEKALDIPEEKKCSMIGFEWPDNPLIVLGSESLGIDPELYRYADRFVEIPSLGSVRSLNVATAAGIAFYDFISKKSI